jgi:hypothetical protein
MKEKEIKGVDFNRVEVLSSREFYLEGEVSKASTKLLSITVKAYK